MTFKGTVPINIKKKIEEKIIVKHLKNPSLTASQLSYFSRTSGYRYSPSRTQRILKEKTTFKIPLNAKQRQKQKRTKEGKLKEKMLKRNYNVKTSDTETVKIDNINKQIKKKITETSYKEIKDTQKEVTNYGRKKQKELNKKYGKFIKYFVHGIFEVMETPPIFLNNILETKDYDEALNYCSELTILYTNLLSVYPTGAGNIKLIGFTKNNQYLIAEYSI